MEELLVALVRETVSPSDALTLVRSVIVRVDALPARPPPSGGERLDSEELSFAADRGRSVAEAICQLLEPLDRRDSLARFEIDQLAADSVP